MTVCQNYDSRPELGGREGGSVTSPAGCPRTVPTFLRNESRPAIMKGGQCPNLNRWHRRPCLWTMNKFTGRDACATAARCTSRQRRKRLKSVQGVHALQTDWPAWQLDMPA